MVSIFEGGCLCGDIRHRASEKPLRGVICHCSMCQRIGWFDIKDDVPRFARSSSAVETKAEDSAAMPRARSLPHQATRMKLARQPAAERAPYRPCPQCPLA
jgi:hypothetical protein